MAKGKRDRRETIRSMAADPDLLDAAVWQQADAGPDAESGGTPETAAQAEPERD